VSVYLHMTINELRDVAEGLAKRARLVEATGRSMLMPNVNGYSQRDYYKREAALKTGGR
jgi:hypothetical protein